MRSPIVPLALLLLAACGDGATTAPDTVPATTLTPAITAALESTLLDEWHAESIYQRVLADHGDVSPFRNIVQAEQRHALAIQSLLTSRALAIPANPWTLDNVPRFASVNEACAAAADAEIANIALYDQFMALALPDDVRTVFTANRRASLDQHLPAFERCR